MSKITQLAGQTAIYGIGHVLPRILHYIVFNTYLTYRLGGDRSEYGIYLELYGYMTILVVMFSFRLDTAIFRFGSRDDNLNEVYKTAFWPILLMAMLVVVVGYAGDDMISAALSYPDRDHYIRWFAWILAFDILILMPYAKLRIQQKALQYTSYKFFNVLLTVLLVIGGIELIGVEGLRERCSYCQSEIDFVFLANLVASAILFFVLMIFHAPRNIHFDGVLFKRMLHYVAPLVLVSIAANFNQFFAVSLQKYFLPGEVMDNLDQASVYGAVQKIPALMALFITAYNYAAEPFFFKNSTKKDTQSVYGEIAKWFVIAAGIIAVGLNSFVMVFLFVIGGNFREGLHIIPILLVAYILLGIYYNVSIWYKLSDMTKYGAIIAGIGSLITMVASVVLLPVFGTTSSAWISVLCYLTMVLLAWYWGKKLYPIAYPEMSIVRHFTIIIIFLTLSYYANLCGGLVGGAAIFVIYLLVIGVIEKHQLIILKRKLW